MKTAVVYDQLLNKIENKYILTIVAGKRMRDLNKGNPALVKTSKKANLMTKVFKEILEDKITFGKEEIEQED
ncbi:MAG: DNA-directed RNA polymerase subunit omega [Fusobacterium sp. JB021]|nr:DNA-directed RNA polymerase subunit omega [Fusobacterium sp. JB020]MDP0492742.1 DNA-directed RNA polymerase subunit omega [Fusobacterium sp. JB021]MDP0507119.1 DNA-directed RNA polymerase subunit omega [Fusobacterium sp. JB019]